VNARSGHEEFERVLRSMHDRLASVSHEIADLLAKLEWHAEAAGPDVRMHARHAAADVVRTQDWLNHRMSHLPLDPSQRYAAMQEMLQVQFVALQKVATIVNDVLTLRSGQAQIPAQIPAQFPAQVPAHPAHGHPLPPLAPPQQANPFALAAPQQQPQQGMQYPPQHATQYPHEANWDVQAGVQGLLQPPGPPVRLADLTPALDTPRTVTKTKSVQPGARAAKPTKKGKKKTAETRGTTRRLAVWSGALLGAIIVLGGIGYVAYANFGSHKSTLAARATPRKERVSLGDPSARDQALANAETLPGGPSRVPSPPPMSSPPLTETGAGGGRVPGLIVAQPQAPRPDARAQPFVAVIATHRDKQALAKIYNDLRKQFPSVLGSKRADAQTVDLGENGVWHHLILLPPGPREQAEGYCAELRAAGYPRCMVRPL
jgi:hypothetical protein